MLMVTDFGCCRHVERHLKFFGPEAKVMENVVANLPAEGDCHTYICDYGYSHRLTMAIQMPEVLAPDGAYERSQGLLQSEKRALGR